MSALDEIDEQEIDRRIERKLRGLGLLVPDMWMTPAEAAAYARMSKWHFQRLCRQGRGPESVGSGKLMRFRRSACDKWLDDQKAVRSDAVADVAHGQQTGPLVLGSRGEAELSSAG